ncbi:hypothetical protein [Roseimicrobium sp. ORNL1]|uniref:hypothetical protein n=1 Tax=Roseimicrobium sp. ORNL1 TaxID=2711231 RepID=UPI0013E14158|nr:hypothetical protein [Roseimicrobium sp. ORNL1]QIF05528.1 hypothetical protein G5S37_29860 [Roseimicrobium sp. ORNL1]
MSDDKTLQGQPSVNPGYAAGQMHKAMETAVTHPDQTTRDRAEAKAQKWSSVIQGLLSGALGVGSRQPLKDKPVWATLEVVTGGFATGRLLAGGHLLQHEEELLLQIPNPAAMAPREVLNRYFLSEPGFKVLRERVLSGRYEINVPEEGALPVIVWLASSGHLEAAEHLLQELAPYFAELRFYPAWREKPVNSGARVLLESAQSVKSRLKNIQPRPGISAQREAIQVWLPYYREVIGLFLETVEGDPPSIRPDEAGSWVSPETGKFHVEGGWPCQKYPADWQARAQRLVQRYRETRATNTRCSRPEKYGDSFAQLRAYLERCAADPKSLTGRDVGKVRLILARHIAKYGTPGAEKAVEHEKRQQAQIAPPGFHDIAAVVRNRLGVPDADSGLESVDALAEPISATEAVQFNVPAGTQIPGSIVRKASRCLCATADVLIDKGIISSADTLAVLIPQFTSNAASAALEDPVARTLYAAVYRAFRRRRSLLLLNLESQVKLKELPWIAALDSLKTRHQSAGEEAAVTLKEVAMLAMRSFPEAIIPNKLLKEFRALSSTAQLNLPLVEELAADIFMNAFSPAFIAAAKQAAIYLKGTLYERYFELDPDTIQKLPDREKKPASRWPWSSSKEEGDPLAYLCTARSGLENSANWSVARNGMVIEQAQILTTHNLAVLFRIFELRSELQPDLSGMAMRCFEWICRRQQVKSDSWHAKLIKLKNTAYAWRQMIFFLSLLPSEKVAEFLAWAKEHLAKQSPAFHERFTPALLGLEAAHHGKSPSTGEGCRFLGWTITQHWLLQETKSPATDTAAAS